MNAAATFFAVLAAVLAAVLMLDPRGTTHRVHNFSAGPGGLPLSVIEEAQGDLADYRGSGMGLFEMSHRDVGGPVQSMIAGAADQLRTLLDVPESHAILYMQGGAHGQFAAVPGNLGVSTEHPGCYIGTGYWSRRAAAEAERYVGGDEEERVIRVVSGVSEDGGELLEPSATWEKEVGECSYVHFCSSETIDGVEFLDDSVLPSIRNVPLVADFTSTLLSRRVDFSRYGVIYASGGKNLGPAGFVVVIVRRDLIDSARRLSHVPSVLNWELHATSQPIHSIYNTPPTLALYFHSLVLQHLAEGMGNSMKAVEERAIERADLIYSVVDQLPEYYCSKVKNPLHRSRMNVPLTIGSGDTRRVDLEKRFVKEAEREGMVQLFGHPVTGGLRVTLYNGVRDESVAKVREFMLRFAEGNPL